MAHIDNNSFQGLISSRNNNDEGSKASDLEQQAQSSTTDKSENKEDASWTVQSSNKTRRLVPQVSLTRQNLGTDNNVRNKPATLAAAATTEATKKKVIRFTKDELLNLRKEATSILPSMEPMADIHSIEPFDPVCNTPLENDEVVKIWNSSNKDKEAAQANNTGRVRGRRPKNGGEDGDGKNELWDDEPATSAGDLTSLAAASLHFRSSLHEMNAGEGDELEGERDSGDAMEDLLEEQRKAERDETDDLPLNGLTFGAKGVGELSLNDPIIEINSNKHTMGSLPLVEPSPHLKALELLYTDPKLDALSLGSTSLTGNTAFGSLGTGSFNALGGDSFLRPLQPTISIGEIEWFYTDPNQQIQGPFNQDIMRVWNEEGYFTGDLPIKARNWTKFYLFKQIFPDARTAFHFLTQEPQPTPFGLNHIQIHQGAIGAQQPVPVNPTILPLGVRSSAPVATQPSNSFSGGLNLGFEPNTVNIVEPKTLPLPAQRSNNAATAALKQAVSVSASQPVQAAEESKSQVTAGANLSKSDIAKQLLGIKGKDSGVAAAAAFKTSSVETNIVQSPPQQVPTQPKEQEVVDKRAIKQQKAIEKTETVQQKPHKSAVTLHETSAEPSSNASLDKIVAPLVEKIVKEQQQQQSQTTQQQQQQQTNNNKTVQQPTKTWNTSSTSKSKVSLATIQKQEEDEKRKDPGSSSSNTDTSSNTGAQNTNQPNSALSFTLKSVLGVKSGCTPQPQQASAAPWTNASAETSGLSLKQIMEQEELSQEQQRKQRQERAQTAGVVGNSWAAKARTGVPLTAPELVPPSVAPVVPTNTSTAASPTPSSPLPLASPSPSVSAKPQQAPQVPVPAPKKGSQTTSDNFGGKQMSKEMEEWCLSQLKRINGTDDATLMKFCMSLNSAVDIRETLSTYLGSSVAVTNFATEFIRYKEEGKRPASLAATDKASIAQSNNGQNSGFISATKKKKPTK